MLPYTRHIHKLVATAAVALTALFAVMAVLPGPAEASTLRYMGWNKYDMLLNGDETRAASSSLGGASFTCWNSGLANKIAIVPCMGMVSVCAAKARLRGRRAGLTVQPVSWTGPRFWCWDY